MHLLVPPPHKGENNRVYACRVLRMNIMTLRLEGNSYEEVARALRLNVNTLKTYKKQIYRTLRDRLADVREFVLAIVFIVLFV